ncbi:hypothetical protein C8Q76DRAFT_722556 [Earliella scabrosa]|nr:hypothetical protein C8Q76DRAFT_722556 [Earliella scabrosa]
MSLSRTARASIRLPSRRSPLAQSRTRAPSRAHVHARPLSSSASSQPPRSRHAQFYTDYAAGMIPVALLGSAVYIGLRTWQQHLAHERFLDEAQVRVQELEAEVTALRQQVQSGGGEGASQNTNSPAEPKKRAGWWPW